MPGRKVTPREFALFVGMVLGGFVAVVIGQWLSRWVIESRDHTLITIGVGAVIGGAIAGFATRKCAQAERSAEQRSSGAAANRRAGSPVQGMP